jgi:hypothetical protein
MIVAAGRRAVRNAGIRRPGPVRPQLGRYGKRTYSEKQVADISSLLLFRHQPQPGAQRCTHWLNCSDTQTFN